jgi:hypothetical protein
MNLFMLPFGPLSQYNGCIVIHIENNENQKKFNTQPPFLPNNFFFGPIQCMLQCVIGWAEFLFLTMFLTYFCLAQYTLPRVEIPIELDQINDHKQK